ncbi:unnamed protein product, partial [Cladocopium goreaui]
AKKMALEKKALGGKPRSTIPQKDLGSPMNVFKGYDLQELNIPLECRPGEQGSYQGRHGYTAIEVLLKNRAFVVKRLPADMPPSADNRKGQVTWSKYESVLAAWNDA